MKEIYLTYKYRIYPNNLQIDLIDITFNSVRIIYNLVLDDLIRHYEQTGTIFKPCLDDYMKEPHYSFEGIDPLALSHTLIIAERDFRNALKGNNYPGHKRSKGKQSYSIKAKQNRVAIKDGFVSLPYVGDVIIVLHRQMPNNPINATIIKEVSGEYYIAFLFVKTLQRQDYALATPDNTIGLDYSNKDFYIDNNGNSPNHPHFYKQEEEHLYREIAKLRRKQRGSANYKKQLHKVRKIYRKIVNRRRDWLHKESTRLADAYEYVAVEDLDLQSIAGTYKLGKNAMDNSYRKFLELLDYKLEQRGKLLFKINRYIRSSQTCNSCGYINKQLQLSDRFWKCPKCGKLVARDHNAAINIQEQVLKYRG